MNSFERVEDP